MKGRLMATFFALWYAGAHSQIMFKAEYFDRSKYEVNEHTKDEDGVGVQTGSALIYNSYLNLQLSSKLNENNQPTVWGLSGNLAYAKLDNGRTSKVLSLNEMSNLSFAIYNLRPLNKKWSLLSSLGAGIYAPTAKASQIGFNTFIGNFGVVFIRRLKPNLELGGGLALNNNFGYPMLFPAIYFNWVTEDKVSFKVSMVSGLEISAGYKVNKNLDLSLVTELTGQGAVVKFEEKSKIVSHQYVIVGLRPEFKIGKRVTIPITAGINAGRALEYRDRSIKSIFSEAKGYNFKVAPYYAFALTVNIN